MKRTLLIIFVLFPLIVKAAYTPVGTDSTIDVLTWNIENFPLKGQATVDEVTQIISDLNTDMIAVQEIASVDDFNQLLSQLPGWVGILSSHEYSSGSYQKVGLIYREEIVTVHSYQLLFEDDEYAFPRPPMEFNLTAQEGGHTFDLRMIVVHLKAFDDEDSEARRRSAIEQLKNYIDSEVSSGDEDDFIFLGDMNDHLEDPAEDNVFTVMLDDTANYEFLSKPLFGYQGSYIGLNEPNLIDHIVITDDARPEYGKQGATEVLYLDDQNSSYETDVSDHRPVLSKFSFKEDYLPLMSIHNNFSDYQGRVVTVEGVVTIGAGIFSTDYTSAYIQDYSQSGINIYNGSEVITDLTQGRQVEVTGEVIDYNGLHEIKYFTHSVLAENQPLPDPALITSFSINDTGTDPGLWITVKGEIESISSPPHINMMINDGSGSAKVYFDPDANLDVSEFNTGDWIEITSVKTVYNQEGQAQPGYQTDIKEYDPSLVKTKNVLPRKTQLFQNYPNPFNPQTTIIFEVENPAVVSLKVYNSTGQIIRTLLHEPLLRGRYHVNWNGRSDSGNPASSGIYFYRLVTNGIVNDSHPMLLIR